MSNDRSYAIKYELNYRRTSVGFQNTTSNSQKDHENSTLAIRTTLGAIHLLLTYLYLPFLANICFLQKKGVCRRLMYLLVANAQFLWL